MSSSPTRVIVHGAAGRMGRQLLRAVCEREDAELVGAIDAPGSEALGQAVALLCPEAGTDLTISDDIHSALSKADVIIDFTAPEPTLALLQAAESAGVAAVVGTTGLSAQQRASLDALAERLPIVFAANYSVGVTIALDLLARATEAFGNDYDIEVIEAHHHHKVDAPSGTALAMGEVMAAAKGQSLDDIACRSRDGIIGARPSGEIGFSTIRAGDIVGEHTVYFAGKGERLELTHRATDRMTFARGAVRAALWVAEQPAGGRPYDMRDVLGMQENNKRIKP